MQRERPPAVKTRDTSVNTDHVGWAQTNMADDELPVTHAQREEQQLQRHPAPATAASPGGNTEPPHTPPGDRKEEPHTPPAGDVIPHVAMETNVPDDNKLADQLQRRISLIEAEKSKLEQDVEHVKKSSIIAQEELKSHNHDLKQQNHELEAKLTDLVSQLEEERKDKATVEASLSDNRAKLTELEQRVAAILDEGEGHFVAREQAQKEISVAREQAREEMAVARDQAREEAVKAEAAVAKVTEENSLLRNQLQEMEKETKEEISQEREKVGACGVLGNGVLGRRE